MNDDLISRQAAIEALGEEPEVWNEWTDEYALGLNNQWNSDVDALKAVPSAQQWIPVEEQNPEIDMSYPHSVCYLVTYEGGMLDVARWSNVNPFWTDHVTEPRWWGQQFCKVVAWMPLPTSYRERSEND